MTAQEYMQFVLTSDDPYQHSVNDEEFKSMSQDDQRQVVRAFSGYGLRDMLSGPHPPALQVREDRR